MARADNWMPLYVADYLRDTMHLTTELHGAYMLLLMACWTRGGALPSDDAQLSGIARMPISAWKRAKPIMAGFFKVEGSEWTHKRVQAELLRAHELSEKRRSAGAKGGRPRAQTESKQKPIGLAKANQSVPQNETPKKVARPLPSEVPDTSSDASASAQGASPQERALAIELRSLLGKPKVEPVDTPPDPDAQAWSLAVSVLAKQGGLSEKQARAFFGAALKRFGLKGSDLLVALIHAEDAGTLDPQSYITAAAQKLSGQRKSSSQSFRESDYERDQQNLTRAFGATPTAPGHGGRDVRDDDAFRLAAHDR